MGTHAEQLRKDMESEVSRKESELQAAQHSSAEEMAEAESIIKNLEKKVKERETQIERMMKYWSVVDQHMGEARAEFLGAQEGDLRKARTAYEIKLPPGVDAASSSHQSPDYQINEFVVEALHNLLLQVDGRYVRPLSSHLQRRNGAGINVSQDLVGGGGGAGGGGAAQTPAGASVVPTPVAVSANVQGGGGGAVGGGGLLGWQPYQLKPTPLLGSRAALGGPAGGNNPGLPC